MFNGAEAEGLVLISGLAGGVLGYLSKRTEAGSKKDQLDHEHFQQLAARINSLEARCDRQSQKIDLLQEQRVKAEISWNNERMVLKTAIQTLTEHVARLEDQVRELGGEPPLIIKKEKPLDE